MGFFDFLKRFTASSHGQISNEAYQRLRQKEIKRLERKYDLSTVDGINAIPVPRSKLLHVNESVTGKIEYYLMLKGGQYEKAGESELAIACYRKANELMPMSSTYYPYETYMRLPRYLRKLRRFDEARAEEEKIRALFPDGGDMYSPKSVFIQDMLYMGHTRAAAEKLYLEYKTEHEAFQKKELNRSDYDWLWEFMPELCPKSLSGYVRMKNANTENYQKIVAEAKKRGRLIK